MHSPRSQLDTMTVQRECTAPRRLIGDGSAEEQSDTIREARVVRRALHADDGRDRA